VIYACELCPTIETRDEEAIFRHADLHNDIAALREQVKSTSPEHRANSRTFEESAIHWHAEVVQLREQLADKLPPGAFVRKDVFDSVCAERDKALASCAELRAFKVQVERVKACGGPDEWTQCEGGAVMKFIGSGEYVLATCCKCGGLP